eukprot:NODE_2275_length_608_cov_53.459459_g2225_i0.p1 GENE.NODE_2275_length_608_cov_53.459459_g2225_i0~~NODE_2275_length_608_cov_53.459459_g2225_i0.p1  ORF type:complete len:127 (-),score=9.84 NODE_2275_length_608_cov_53.459459_g2225_i0:110-490(-)
MCQVVNHAYPDTTLFGEHIVGKEGVSCIELIRAGQEALLDTVAKLTEKEVDHAKSQALSDLLLLPDGFTSIADELGREVIAHGEPLELAETVEAVQGIDWTAVRDVGYKQFGGNPCLAAIGDLQTQ